MAQISIDKKEIVLTEPTTFVNLYFEVTEEARAKAEWAAHEFFDTPSASLINRLAKTYAEKRCREMGIRITPRFPYDTIAERLEPCRSCA